jgi:hypothetical protein
MIAESPYCCKMYANFPRCTHLGNIITVMLYNMTESESQICCKMYENDAICMQMRLRYMSNVYTVSLFPQSKQYKGPNNAKYVRMYKVQHHRCMYTVHVGRCSTESTPNNLFMHLVCPPPPSTNREATSYNQHLCVHTTWKYRPAGKHTQHSGHSQSSMYSGTARNLAPVHVVRKIIINRCASFRRMRLLSSYICSKIRLILVRQPRHLCYLSCIILVTIMFLRNFVVIEGFCFPPACREKYKKIQGFIKEKDVKRTGIETFYNRPASIQKEVYLSVRTLVTKMSESESGSRSEGGGSGKLLSFSCQLFYTCPVLCLLAYDNENLPLYNFLQIPLYAVEPISMLTTCTMLCNCSLRYGE